MFEKGVSGDAHISSDPLNEYHERLIRRSRRPGGREREERLERRGEQGLVDALFHFRKIARIGNNV
jgi:hypothetical protein